MTAAGDMFGMMEVTREAAVYQRTAEFLAGFNYGVSDREKAEHVYESIEERTVYDTGEFKPDSDTIYGALVLGKSECVGFARMYKLLSNAVGLRCGTSYTFGARESAWICPVCGIEYDNPSFK